MAAEGLRDGAGVPLFTSTTRVEVPGSSMPRTRPWNFRSIPDRSTLAITAPRPAPTTTPQARAEAQADQHPQEHSPDDPDGQPVQVGGDPDASLTVADDGSRRVGAIELLADLVPGLLGRGLLWVTDRDQLRHRWPLPCHPIPTRSWLSSRIVGEERKSSSCHESRGSPEGGAGARSSADRLDVVTAVGDPTSE
jgi:hypothetical protein